MRGRGRINSKVRGVIFVSALSITGCIGHANMRERQAGETSEERAKYNEIEIELEQIRIRAEQIGENIERTSREVARSLIDKNAPLLDRKGANKRVKKFTKNEY